MDLIRPSGVPGLTLTPAEFLAAHTIVDQTVPVNDECPICLDNYSAENCLRITGIPGCTHHIGQACLSRLLSSRPDQEKRCPMCRATWIAPIPEPRRRIAFPARGRGLVHGVEASLGQRERDNPALPPVPLRRTPELVIIDSDSDTEEEYNRTARDHESVRARARTSEPSRAQRQARPLATPSLFHPHLETHPTLRPNHPTRVSSLRRQPSARSNVPSNDGTERNSLFTGSRFEAPRLASGRPRLNINNPCANPTNSSPETVVADDPEVVGPPMLELRATRVAELDQREHELDVRAAALNARELRLNKREEALRNKVRGVMAQEERMNTLVQLARSQQEEKDEMARVHAQALEGLMRE